MRDHIVVFLSIDDKHYQVEMRSLYDGHPDADLFWIASDVRDMDDNLFWAIDPAPMGATPGECLDAVIAEARR